MTVVSIVIPFHGSVELLRQQLAALRDQDTDATGEVIIANNDPFSNLAEREIQTEGAWPYRLVLTDATRRPGPSHARNCGVRAARGEFILFCDADDVVSKEWVRNLLDALRAGAGMVGGRLDYTALNDAALGRWTTHTQTSLPTKFDHLPFAMSCNMGIGRQLLQDLGGWEEDLRVGEDIDLSWKLQYAGHRLQFVPSAVVSYRLRDSLTACWRQAYSYGRGDADLLTRHRDRGARRHVRRSVQDVAAAGLSTLAPFYMKRGILKTATRWGALAGRIVGSVERRELAV